MLELKRPISFEQFYNAFAFQSYHAGIETFYQINKKWYDKSFQSYHAGIETADLQEDVQPDIIFQSYHAGIETWLRADEKNLQEASNRTMLELKLWYRFRHLPV